MFQDLSPRAISRTRSSQTEFVTFGISHDGPCVAILGSRFDHRRAKSDQFGTSSLAVRSCQVEVDPVLDGFCFGHRGERQLCARSIGGKAHKAAPVVRDFASERLGPEGGDELGIVSVDNNVLNGGCDRHAGTPSDQAERTANRQSVDTADPKPTITKQTATPAIHGLKMWSGGDDSPPMDTLDSPSSAGTPLVGQRSRERKGRKWLLVSFLFCPCHLPVIMAVLGVLFGGTALGAVVGRNTIGVGIVFGVIYAILLAVGFRHLKAATRDIDCSDGECVLPS